MKEDRLTNTPQQASAYEAQRGMDEDYYDDRPTLAEACRDEEELNRWSGPRTR